jgi:hypothetical protein
MYFLGQTENFGLTGQADNVVKGVTAAGKAADRAATIGKAGEVAATLGKQVTKNTDTVGKVAGKGVDNAAAKFLAKKGKKADDVAGAAAKKADDVAGAGAKKADDVAGAGAKKADDAAGAGAKKADDAVGAGAKKADDAAEAGAKNADDVAGAAAKNADDAAEAAAKNLDEAAETAAKEIADNPGLLSKMAKIMKKNPGKTLAAALVISLGTAGLILAQESFNANNNKKLGIIKSYKTKDGDKGDITIEYTPDAEFVDGDKVELTSTDFVEPHTGQEIPVKKILSKNSIIINVPDITTYATSGTVTLHTTLANRMADQAEKAAEATAKLADKATGGILSGTMNKLKDALGSAFGAAKGCCGVVCCLICLAIMYKLFSMFKK